MTPLRTQPIFRTEVGQQEYDKVVRGLLSKIYGTAELRLAPAKGGTPHPEYYDQSAFAHSVNVATVGGLLYEEACLETGREPERQEMRIVLYAGALHDFNKFVDEIDLLKSLKEDDGLFEELVEGSLSEDERETVRHLILQTEATSSKEAREFGLVLNPKIAGLIARCLNLADALSGGKGVDPNDHRRYRELLERKRGDSSRLPEVHILPFTVVPQTLLAQNVRRCLFQWIRDQDGAVLHVTEAYVSWVGPGFETDALNEIEERFINRIRPSLDDALSNSTVGQYNTIKPTWIEYHEPTPENVDAFIEEYLGRMLLLQGSWANENFEILHDRWEHFRYDEEGQATNKVALEVPEKDDVSSEEEKEARIDSKILIASCLAATLEDDDEVPDQLPADFEMESLRGVTKKAAKGIIRAYPEPAEEKVYERYLDRVSTWLTNQDRCLAFRESLEGFARQVLGYPTVDSLEPPSNEYGCIYCGAEADRVLERDHAFGFGPTAWGPRMRGVQRESDKAKPKICPVCVVEAQVRQGIADASGVPGNAKKLLGVHLHAADLWADTNVSTLLDGAFKDEQSQRLIGEDGKRLVLIPKGSGTDQTVPAEGHISTFMPVPDASRNTGRTLAHLYRLRDLLSFAAQFGFKVQVSPLQLHARHHKPFVKWENGPSWMHGLGIDEVRIDQLSRKLEFTEALIRVGQEAGSKNGHATVINSILQQPLEVYTWPVRSPSDSEESNPTDVLEREIVPDNVKDQIDEAAEAFCEFNPGGEYTKNKWTWAAREALDAAEAHWEREDRAFRVVADLYPQAERKNEYARREDLEEFVDALESYLQEEHPEAPPIGRDKRSLINAIAYRAQQINSEKYKERQAEQPLEA